MEDVARRAGVSRALVSIVFRDMPGASEENRQRVRRAAEDLGYAPDHRARLLSRSRSKLIGVVYGLHHEFHGELVEAMYGAAAPLGYEITVSGFAPTRSETDAVASLLSYRCESLIMVAPTLSAASLAALAEQVPIVVVARKLRAAAVDVVRTDDVDGGREATNHLIQQGHSGVVHIDGGRAAGSTERLRGYRQAMKAARLGERSHIITGGLTEEDGVRAARELWPLLDGTPTAPSAVFAFNDRCALGALTTLQNNGINVPGEISLIGYDDSRVARLPWAQLTTMRQSTGQLADHALRLALSRIDDPASAREVVVAPQLVRRRTTGPHGS
ncbi:MAG TPA: LacI family DNA-binding transcriptional regulator [Propionibacteriaceae bacterium]|nr:LacI family DNA-binding transcriptional regulator [Propionibacteriaceae bacterium]